MTEVNLGLSQSSLTLYHNLSFLTKEGVLEYWTLEVITVWLIFQSIIIHLHCLPVARILIEPSEAYLVINDIWILYVWLSVVDSTSFLSPKMTLPRIPFQYCSRSEFVNERNARYRRWKRREIIFRNFGMSHGWIWGNRDFGGFLGMPTWLYRLRCLAGTFPEPLENFSRLPMKLLRTTKFGSSNETCRDCFNHLQPQPSLSSLMQLFLRSCSP